jgi:hypothetical protein
MPQVRALYYRTKTVGIYPLGGDRYLVAAELQDELHDVCAEVEIVHPSLEIVAARSEVRNGPFTQVCNLTHPNMEKLVGMKVGRGFTVEARKLVGGTGGCHRVSELVVEIAQAAYQLHFVLFFQGVSKEEQEKHDVPVARWKAVNNSIPGMRNTCFAYNDQAEELIRERATPVRFRDHAAPIREVP